MSQKKRSTVSLLTAFSFVVMAVTGVMAFALPFSIQIVGLHSLIGFVFIGLIALHVFNNNHRLTRYLKSRIVWIALAVVALLVALFLWQPAPIKSVLGLSKNLGPSLDDYEVTDLGLSYHYTPDPGYKMALTVRSGTGFDPESPPNFAIWLENASEYHIKTLHTPTGDGGRTALPYWDFKRRGWEEAKRDAESSGKDLAEELEVDAVSGATENSSFNPADYILPGDAEESLPYRLLIEINQPGDDQASLVYAVDIDNITPRTFQLLDLVGYPKREEDDEDGKEVWVLYYIDGSFSTALQLIDSALLTIERSVAR
ncbi:MAG: DUF4405 domain-containing protein [Verrucomicrobiales bacterium]|nr:DUF4405 domain-containing protein [Verrucomicrobiales bacterium]